MKLNEDLIELVNSKVNSGLLFEEEWKGIIYYLYEENDARLIEAKIVEEMRNQINSKIENHIKSNKISREEVSSLNRISENRNISYKSFLKIILDFQIRSRVNYLKKFTLLFKSVDLDSNGIISENEFLTMLSNISFQQKIELEPITGKLLNILDPFNNKQINYSDCINVFSKEVINLNERGNNDTLLNIIVNEYGQN